MGRTKFTGLEVTGSFVASGLTKSGYTVTSGDAEAAAGTSPTKAEYDAAVTLLNELKANFNKLVSQLCTGSDT